MTVKTYLLIITWNINELNSPIKKTQCNWMDKKEKPNDMLFFIFNGT
jgi:exonuclease III